MRSAVISVLALLLLAGCLQGSNPSPGVGDGGTTHTTPASSTPISTTPTVTTPTPTGPRPTGGAAVRPAHGSNSSAGFTLEGDESVSLIVAGQNVTFTFVGTNGGANATALFAICDGGNPRVEIQDANGTVLDPFGPRVRCLAASGWTPMPGGEQRWGNFTWDGRAWDGDKLAPVSPGAYYAVGTFLAKRDGHDVTIEVRLPVGVTDNRGAL